MRIRNLIRRTLKTSKPSSAIESLYLIGSKKRSKRGKINSMRIKMDRLRDRRAIVLPEKAPKMSSMSLL
jgi:hypothetical protein